MFISFFRNIPPLTPVLSEWFYFLLQLRTLRSEFLLLPRLWLIIIKLTTNRLFYNAEVMKDGRPLFSFSYFFANTVKLKDADNVIGCSLSPVASRNKWVSQMCESERKQVWLQSSYLTLSGIFFIYNSSLSSRSLWKHIQRLLLSSSSFALFLSEYINRDVLTIFPLNCEKGRSDWLWREVYVKLNCPSLYDFIQ